MAGAFNHIGIIGGGAWGTGLATVMCRAGRSVTLWVRETALVKSINERHENDLFLPGLKLDRTIKATNTLGDLGTCDALLLAVPAQHTRLTAQQIAKLNLAKVPIVICAKGIEQK